MKKPSGSERGPSRAPESARKKEAWLTSKNSARMPCALWMQGFCWLKLQGCATLEMTLLDSVRSIGAHIMCSCARAVLELQVQCIGIRLLTNEWYLGMHMIVYATMPSLSLSGYMNLG